MKYGVQTKFKEAAREKVTTVYKTMLLTIQSLNIECKLEYLDLDARIIKLSWNDDGILECDLLKVLYENGIN